MPTDIEIAHRAKLLQISEVARRGGIRGDELDFHGNYIAKVNLSILRRLRNRPNGRLINITAITPTPKGEGKTCTSIGLTQALGKMKRKVMLCLREPSIGPLFGVKGGGTGSGHAQVIPMEDINLHFTGDIHAVGCAHNLLAAMVDNHLFRDNPLNLDPDQILWPRAIDMNDRTLRHVTLGTHPKSKVTRPDSFVITAASEVMAILALCTGYEDLKKRLNTIVVGYTRDNQPVFAHQIKAVGAMAALLKEAIKPNLVQTLEGQPAFIHTGPFANIATGNASLLSLRIALKLSDYVVAESGFGTDLGAEKLYDIICNQSDIVPSLSVVVASIRALKIQGGVALSEAEQPDQKALMTGFSNLERHLQNMRTFGIPCVVAINRFPNDDNAEIETLQRHCSGLGVPVGISDAVKKGGSGAIDLAETVLKTLSLSKQSFHPLYTFDQPIIDKIETVAHKVFGARGVVYTDEARTQIEQFTELGFGALPVNIAKTHLSFSDNKDLKGAPEAWDLLVREVKLAAGAGYLIVIAGNMMLMPGLPAHPVAENVGVDDEGIIEGLF